MLGLSRHAANMGGEKIIVAMADVPNAAGSGENASVTTAISFAGDQVPQNRPGFQPVIGGQLPDRYAVMVAPSQSCIVQVTNKTRLGFSVVMTPNASQTIAVGTMDIVVIG
jgi:hypothetical protein